MPSHYIICSLLSTYSTDKASVMPDVTKGLQELVSSLDGKLTAMTSRPKQTVVVFCLKKKKQT